MAPPSAGKVVARALYSYEAGDAKDVAIEDGDLMDVVEKGSEWWTVRVHRTGIAGLVPANYVEEVVAHDYQVCTVRLLHHGKRHNTTILMIENGWR